MFTWIHVAVAISVMQYVCQASRGAGNAAITVILHFNNFLFFSWSGANNS